MNKKEIYVYHDTETTGTGPEDRVIETAHAAVKNGKIVEYQEELCKPDTVAIKPGAAMTHGYRNSDIKDKPDFNSLKSAQSLIDFSENKNAYYIAHNAPFDLGMLEKEGISFPRERIIDTLRVARHLYMTDESIEMYKLQYFRYVFYNEETGLDEFEEIEPKYMKEFGISHIQPHTALSDILVLWIFHEKVSKDFNLTSKDMVRMTQQPVIENTIQFGNIFERGKPYSEIMVETYEQWGKKKRGYEYLLWAVENMDNLSVDREYTLKYYIANGLINNQISSVSKYDKFINWGMLFSYDTEQIIQALALKGENKSFYKKLCNSYKKQTEKRIKELENKSEEDITEEESAELDKTKFLHNYFIQYRQELIKA